MKRRICFRADAGATIGYGHFIRTLALADMLKDDFDCVFFTTEPSQYQIDELDKVCRFVILHEEGKFEDFLGCLDGTEIVVLDNYFFTTDYQRQIKVKGCKLVCIDDMHDKHYVADAIINHGPVKPEEFDCEPYTKLALGSDYVLLRKPFLQPIQNKQRNNSVVVNFGGADPLHLTDKVISMLLQLNVPYDIITILGDKTYLSDENRQKVTILKNLSAQQMADLFESSAFGILPGSTVGMEAASRGLPLMIGYFVDNQEEGYKKSAENGSFIPLGNLSKLTKDILSSSIDKLKDFQPIVPDYTLVPHNFKILFEEI